MKHFANLVLILSLLVVFSSCSTIADTEGDKINQRGLNFRDSSMNREAIECFKKARSVWFASDDFKGTVFRNEGIAHLSLSEDDSAKSCFMEAANLSKEDSYLYLVNMSDVYLIEKKIKKSIGCLKKAMKYEDADFMVYNNLGLIYLGDYGEEYEDFESALFCNKKAYELAPEVTTRFLLAKNYYFLERYSEAEPIFEEVLKEFPENTIYLIYMVYTKEALEKETEAIRFKQTLERVDPELYQEYFGEQE